MGWDRQSLDSKTERSKGSKPKQDSRLRKVMLKINLRSYRDMKLETLSKLEDLRLDNQRPVNARFSHSGNQA